MSETRPSTVIRDGVLVVSLETASAGREKEFDAVLDQTDLGDVVGIEILDLRRQLGGGTAPPSPADGFPRWSYDDEIDAFYVRVADGPAQVQKDVTGRALLDEDGRLISLELRAAP